MNFLEDPAHLKTSCTRTNVSFNSISHEPKCPCALTSSCLIWLLIPIKQPSALKLQGKSRKSEYLTQRIHALPNPNHNANSCTVFPFVPIMIFETGRKILVESKIPFSEHTGPSLLGCLSQFLMCMRAASGLVLGWVCCQNLSFTAYSAFLLSGHDLLHDQERRTGAESIV